MNYPWRMSDKNKIFDLLLYGSWRKKGNKEYNKINSHFFSIGGSGNFIFELSKKYGIFMNKISKSYKLHFAKFFINYFFDKYEQHANQRNRD